MRRLVPVVIVLSALVGCGGGNTSANDEVVSTVRRYFAAIAAGNGPQACSLLSPRERLYLREKRVSCPQAVTVAHSSASSTFQQLRNVALSTPVVRDDVAVVHALPFGKSRAIALLKMPGGWRINTIEARPEAERDAVTLW